MKGRPWCDDLPVVTVGRSSVPKRVTLIYPYYDQPQFFEFQLKHWRTYPPELRSHLSIIVVDDGSPTLPAERVLTEIGWPTALRLFRIDVDVRWGWLGARNRGAERAREGWLLLTDMDHVVPTETLDAIIHGVHRVDRVYVFSRKEHTGETLTPHSASFLMTRQMFWTIGGYDERLAGFYGTDGIYRRRLAQHAKINILPEHLVRYEFVGDSSVTRYKRKQAEDAGLRQLVASLPPNEPIRVCSYPYHEVAA